MGALLLVAQLVKSLGVQTTDLYFSSLLCLGDVVVHMNIVSQLDADLDDIQAHLYDMLASGAVVPGAHIALEGILHAS